MSEFTRENGFLKRGATKCPDCKVSLHWEIMGGMRLYREFMNTGKYFYSTKCPSCQTTWEVRK